MKQQLQVICEYKGGSHSYGLNTPASDTDLRGCYLVDTLDKIIDPHSYSASKCDVQNTDPQTNAEDKCYYEVRHYLHLLKKGNTQSVEMIFNSNWTKLSPLFTEIIKNRKNLIDPGNIYNAIRGYSFSEYSLAQGLRTGKLGGKRQKQVEQYGFSPKNWVNLLRILYCGEHFFETGNYLVNLTGNFMHPQLMEIKVHPERFTKERLEEMFTERQKAFEASWAKNEASITKEYSYNNKIATELMLKCYKDTLFKLGRFSILDELLYLFSSYISKK
jgi:predicted nucleotidyltransferase